MLRLAPGDVILLRQRDSGQEHLAHVDHVTKGGRVVAWWWSRMRDRAGKRTKPVTLDPARYQIVRLATSSECRRFERGSSA